MFKGLNQLTEAVNKKNLEIVKIADGQAKVFRILSDVEELIGVYEHTEQINGKWKTLTCLDRNYGKQGECPLCLADKRPSFRVYIPVLDREDNKVKIFKASKDVTNQIIGLSQEYGDLTSRDYKVIRSGSRLNTSYQFFPKDPSKEDLSQYQLPDIEERIAPLSKEAIAKMLTEGESNDYDESDLPF
jgi:hypothetical protein